MTMHGAPTLTDAVAAPARTRVARVLVLDRAGEFSAALARATAGMDPAPELFRLRRPVRVAEVAGAEDVDVIVAGPGEVTHAGLKRLADVHRADPRVVILLSPNGRPVSVRETAASGASGVLPYPAGPVRMRNALARALEESAQLRAERVVVRTVEAPERVTRQGAVYTVTSATGGCGKTFFATNLAGYLARATGGRVLLVDLDLQFGEVSVSLHLRPERTIAELAELDPDAIAGSLGEHVVRHEAGFDVLCAPLDPIVAERVGPEHASAILEAASARYDHVVVDTPPSLNEIVLAAFDRSQSLVVMATMDVPSLKNLNVFLHTLERLKVPADDVSLVLNKAERGTGIEIDQVLALYPQGFAAVLPYAREVSRSINVGMPVVFSEPGADVSRKLVAGAMKLVPPPEGADLSWTASAPAGRTRRLRRLFRMREKGASR